MMRTVPIFLLLCSPALAHDTGHSSLTNGSTGSNPAGGYVVRSRTALLSAMLIGNLWTAIIESALRITGSMFPMRP
jgi:hypothetical protein